MGQTLKVDLSYTQPQVDIFFPGDPRKYTVVTKGRRFGATHGAALAYVEKLLCGEGPFLWGDTIHANIDKYFERYFLPALNKNNIPHHFNRKNKQLTINGQYMDFRSADKPENWEGFGYKEIFLNEAGIILNNDYLYTNAILPMLLDYPDSRLIAAGVPKGKLNKLGGEHKFYFLYKQAQANPKKYKLLQYSSYDNPLLRAEDIAELEMEMELMDPEQVRQEVYGEFIDGTAVNPFAIQYEQKKHEGEIAEFRPIHPVYFSIDFNVTPFGCIAFQMWVDRDGPHCHVVNEYSIKKGTTSGMSDAIKLDYERYLHLTELTGDHMGTNAQINRNDNNALFTDLRNDLRLLESQIRVPANPRHKKSRNDVNYFLRHFPDFKINPVTCPNTCRDMKIVNVNSAGKIIKQNRNDVAQQADHIDCVRYMINTYYIEAIERHKLTGFW